MELDKRRESKLHGWTETTFTLGVFKTSLPGLLRALVLYWSGAKDQDFVKLHVYFMFQGEVTTWIVVETLLYWVSCGSPLSCPYRSHFSLVPGSRPLLVSHAEKASSWKALPFLSPMLLLDSIWKPMAEVPASPYKPTSFQRALCTLHASQTEHTFNFLHGEVWMENNHVFWWHT